MKTRKTWSLPDKRVIRTPQDRPLKRDSIVTDAHGKRYVYDANGVIHRLDRKKR